MVLLLYVTKYSDEKIVKALIDVNILEPAYNTVVESTWARWEIQGMAFQPSPCK